MREIKFRAWDKSRLTMMPVWGLLFAHHYDVYGNRIRYLTEEWSGPVDYISASLSLPPEEIEQGYVGAAITTDGYFKADDYILMQYTGLKDKNGVEIYEGDIVKYNSQVEGAPERWVGPVAITWNEVKARFDFDNSFNGLIYCAYEIIGNVYDNPELLERS